MGIQPSRPACRAHNNILCIKCINNQSVSDSEPQTTNNRHLNINRPSGISPCLSDCIHWTGHLCRLLGNFFTPPCLPMSQCLKELNQLADVRYPVVAATLCVSSPLLGCAFL